MRTATIERERFFPVDGPPLERMRHFVHHIETRASLPLARLWLNARHLSRFVADVVEWTLGLEAGAMRG